MFLGFFFYGYGMEGLGVRMELLECGVGLWGLWGL